VAIHPGLTADAINLAVAECDRMGRDAFLAAYGFKSARAYELVVNDQAYDSKAIVAVAHKWVPAIGRALRYDELSGGVHGAVAPLVDLGFEVRSPIQDPDWTWDEHVLALDFYFTHRERTPDKSSREIADLSSLLNRLAERAGVVRSDRFRNANGVYMKLMNFRRLDPTFLAVGKVGLTRGAKGEQAVWDRYAKDRSSLANAAQAIRMAIDDATVRLDLPDEDYEAEEGRAVLRLHWSRERDPKLVRLKKAQALKASGRLICEVCDFDFEARYGPHGADFIEAHHTRPVSTLSPGQTARPADLALVCSNCHRMLHRGPSLLSISQLRSILKP
jgi:5-methylcytosine-specific restriction protein A